LPAVPGSAATGVAESTLAPVQSKPNAITQLIAVALIDDRFTTFLELAAVSAPHRTGYLSLWHIRRS
jgi:hypothetical protein